MSSVDRIERLGESLVQHGPANHRVYLMRMASSDVPDLPSKLVTFAREHGYGKVFAKIPSTAAAVFCEAGYETEAEVPGYFRGMESALFVSYYADPRRREGDRTEAVSIRKLAEARAGEPPSKPAAFRADVCRVTADALDEAAALYRQVFASYPFPIHDPAYLRQTQASHVAYYGVRTEGKLVALSSAEKDEEAGAAELTDFAVCPEARGRALAQQLLARMEEDLSSEGYQTGYTIARALSAGMNITFARAGYRFGGLLWKNTQICGTLEPMNVWYRALTP